MQSPQTHSTEAGLAMGMKLMLFEKKHMELLAASPIIRKGATGHDRQSGFIEGT